MKNKDTGLIDGGYLLLKYKHKLDEELLGIADYNTTSGKAVISELNQLNDNYVISIDLNIEKEIFSDGVINAGLKLLERKADLDRDYGEIIDYNSKSAKLLILELFMHIIK